MAQRTPSRPSTRRAPSKADVELAEVHEKAELWHSVIHGTTIIAAIAALAVPLLIVKGIVEPFAGRTTVLHANVALGCACGMSVLMNIAQFVRGSFRKRTIKRTRKRTDELELRLGIGTDAES